ncbi:uncharacterized protein [Lolium perenne]|uniref:uncharacterized protein isoform X2 n=1 Tax=Lolium perenne TaxID=4522 RepID=UPI003A9913BD
MDYVVSIKCSAAPADFSSPRPLPIRLIYGGVFAMARKEVFGNAMMNQVGWEGATLEDGVSLSQTVPTTTMDKCQKASEGSIVHLSTCGRKIEGRRCAVRQVGGNHSPPAQASLPPGQTRQEFAGDHCRRERGSPRLRDGDREAQTTILLLLAQAADAGSLAGAAVVDNAPRLLPLATTPTNRSCRQPCP